MFKNVIDIKQDSLVSLSLSVMMKLGNVTQSMEILQNRAMIGSEQDG